MTDSSRMAMAPKIQILGRTLVMQLHMVLRTMKIHDAQNKALLVATENLKHTINTLWAALDKTVRLQFVDGIAYLNDVRIRLDAGVNQQVEVLQKEFSDRGLGGLAFSRPVDTAALRDFLLRFARPTEGAEDLAELKRSLEEFRELALELLEPRAFSDGAVEEQSLRVDKKTFALQTYAKSIIAVREFVEALRAGKDPMAGRLPITRIVQDLVDIATERVNFLIKLASIKQAHEYAYNHAANTCVLSIVIGRSLNVDRLALVDLGTSALFADIGFVVAASRIGEEDRELTPPEREELIDDMCRSIRMLIGKGQLSEAIMRRVIVAYEHHQPYLDPATSKPRRLHLFSRIVAVADAFDALTTRRPWREGFTADETLRVLSREAGTRFDPLVVKVLINLLGLYPLGTMVRLASGELGVVYHNSNDPKLFERPWVKVVRDVGGQLIKRTVIRNLAETEGPEGQITGFASAEEIGSLDPGMLVVS